MELCLRSLGYRLWNKAILDVASTIRLFTCSCRFEHNILPCLGRGLYSFLPRRHAEPVSLAAGAERLVCKLPVRNMGDMYDAEAPKLRDDGVAMLEKPC